MPLPNKNPDELYTYADYLSWDEEESIEIIDGKPIMQAAPTAQHQFISFELARQLGNYLEGKQCRAVAAPFTVRLFETETDSPNHVKTVVQPDISVICDMSRVDKNGYRGAPDMVIEILSPSTAKYDLLLKLDKYQEAGVKEYWIVDPLNQTVQVLLLENGIYKREAVYSKDEIVKVNILKGCYIDLSKVFTE